MAARCSPLAMPLPSPSHRHRHRPRQAVSMSNFPIACVSRRLSLTAVIHCDSSIQHRPPISAFAGGRLDVGLGPGATYFRCTSHIARLQYYCNAMRGAAALVCQSGLIPVFILARAVSCAPLRPQRPTPTSAQHPQSIALHCFAFHRLFHHVHLADGRGAPFLRLRRVSKSMLGKWKKTGCWAKLSLPHPVRGN